MRAAAVALLLLAAACSRGDPTVDAAPTSTSRPPATTTTSTTSTTSSSVPPATTSTTVGPACLAGDLVPATGQPSDAIEIDGLAGDDTAQVFLADDGWHLRALLGDGGAVDELLASLPSDPVRIRFGADLDGDGSVELLVQVGSGASVEIVEIYDLDGCDLEGALLDGVPAQFAVGGTVLNLTGLACGESDLTVLSATSDDGLTYATVESTYDLEAGSLVRVGDESNTLSADDPDLAAYADFAC